MEQASDGQLLSPTQFPKMVLGQKKLISRFARRGFEIRHKGMILGNLWHLIVPLLLLAVYTFVFSIVFKARWGIGVGESQTSFAIILFASLIPFNILSETLAESTALILNNKNLVTKVVFPLEILPLVTLITVVIRSSIAFALLVFALAITGNLSWHIMLIGVVLPPMLLATLGVAYILASLSVFVRDLSQLIGVIMTFVLFLSPIFYPIEAVPEGLQKIIMLNPFALFLEDFRSVVVLGEHPDYYSTALQWLIGILVLTFGFGFFQKTKSSFADLI